MDIHVRAIHDAAVCIATAATEVIAPCLRDEERNDAWHEFYSIAKAGIEAMIIQTQQGTGKIETV